MRTSSKDSGITIGGAPRVDLLPPEVRAGRRADATTRRAWLGVVVLVAATVVASGAATLHALGAEDDLVMAQGATSSLLSQQAQFTELRTTQNQVDLIEAGQKVGGSTEIDWATYLTQVQATLPVGVTVTSVALDQATPLASYAQGTSPLLGSRVATLTFTASSPSLPSVPVWLDGLATLPGFADALPGSVTLSDGVYTASVTMHINADAFSGRYDEKGQ
jgi:hypothetical protein